MKRYIKTYFTCGLLLVGLLSACKEEDMTLGEGSVRLNVKVSDEVAVVSRAIDPGIYASMQTRIYSSKGLIRYYDRENLMPDILNLASGQYHVFVIAGDSVPAAFEIQGQKSKTKKQSHVQRKNNRQQITNTNN